MSFFKDWKVAHSHAVKLARQIGHDVGIEKFKEYNAPGFRVFSLPKPANRYGFELRREVVSPSDPI